MVRDLFDDRVHVCACRSGGAAQALTRVGIGVKPWTVGGMAAFHTACGAGGDLFRCLPVVLVIGAGGILTELLADSATLLLPATPNEIRGALKGLKVHSLIEGYRGKSGDMAATLDAMEAIARFAIAHDTTLEELDVNPLMVLEPGKGAVAADALIRMRKSQ